MRKVLLMFVCAGLLMAALGFFGVVVEVRAIEEEEQEELEQVIVEACEDEGSADVGAYELTVEEMKELFFGLYYAGRLPWYTKMAFEYSYDGKTGVVKEFFPSSLEGEVDRALYEQRVQEALDVCVLDGMSEYQIALALHDYLAEIGCYDETKTRRSGYDLLVHGTAVCSGYAAAYQDLLRRAGVDSYYVVSEEMNHGWNLVCIDGEWYHVDVTWDDATPDTYGYVRHDYFLLTDEEISSGDKGHFGWDGNIVCDDERFVDGYWRDVDSRICFESSERCYLVREEHNMNRVYARDEISGDERLLYADEVFRVKLDGSWWRYTHYGLSLVDDRLYLNAPDGILSIRTDGTEKKVAYRFDVEGNQQYIQGSFVSNDNAWISLSDSHGHLTKLLVSLVEIDGHMHEYSQTVVEPTCVDAGYTLFACVCGDVYRAEEREPLGHVLTQTEEERVMECEVCRARVEKGVSEDEVLRFGIVVGVFLALACAVGALFCGRKTQKND